MRALGILALMFAIQTASSAAMGQGRLSKAEISAAFIGKTIKYDYGGESDFNRDGSYIYRATVAGGRFGMKNVSTKGTYEFIDGGFCVRPNGRPRRTCYGVERQGHAFVVIGTDGRRYNARFIE